jgi:hypothetical protein
MMTSDCVKSKRNSEWQLPPEVEAVLRASKNLKPCKPKYGRIPYDQFLEQVRKDRCVQRRDFFLQPDKEQRMMAFLREHKN